MNEVTFQPVSYQDLVGTLSDGKNPENTAEIAIAKIEWGIK